MWFPPKASLDNPFNEHTYIIEHHFELFKRNGEIFMEKNKKNIKKPKEVYIPKSTAELLPFVRVEKGMFLMDNGGYMDLFRACLVS